MRHLGEVFMRLARRATAFAETRRSIGVVFVGALAVWWLESLVTPLEQGRDFGTYLGAYLQLFHAHPIDLGYVLGRTPLAPIIVGGLVDLAGGALAAPVVSLLFAGSVVAWFLVARRFSPRAAVLTAVVLVAYPGYGILFHELSSDSVFAAAFAGWSLLVVRTLFAPRPSSFALVGTGVGVLTLIRPGNESLLVLALLPLVLRLPWRSRLVSAGAFLVPAVALIAGWAISNGVRYGDYTLVRGANATVPFFRTFVTDKLVRPSNGPASRELARAVQRDLLANEPYRSYHVTLADFFTKASPRMQTDLVALSDRLKGFDTNQRWLRDVGVEAVRTHPVAYARGVASSIWGMLRQGLYRPPFAGTGRATAGGSRASGGGATVVIRGQRLPKPSEGEPIPAAHEGGVATPDKSIYTVWTSPSEHHLVFVHPGAQARYEALHRRMNELAGNLPDRKGSPTLTHRLNQVSRWFPPPALWLVLGVGALGFRRPRRALALSIPAVAALVVIVVSALGLPAEPHYSLPVAPAFVLLGTAALLGPRREAAAGVQPASWRARMPSLGPSFRVVGIGLGVVAAAWAVEAYVTKIHANLADRGVGHDLDVFLRAAGRVLDGVSPYAFHADKTYAYPPLVAFLAAPFHPLSAGAASAGWTLLSLAAIAAALWLLGLRDWRCYALTAVYPITRSAVDLGTIEPLLLLAVAVAWRWRDRVVEPAIAVGTAVTLKLFVWPIVVWLALTRRIRPAVASVLCSAGLALVTWAAIGFAGLGHYPGLLRRLSREEATSSYSVVALAVRAHLPYAAGIVISLIAAAALLGAAAWVARDEARTQRDRDAAVLTLAVAAGLAASPIVWVHYFLLLLVPLALTRPRLSPVWLVPFAYYPLGESAWPAGDARKLGIALAATLVLIGAGVVRRAGDTDRSVEADPARDRPGAARARRAPESTFSTDPAPPLP